MTAVQVGHWMTNNTVNGMAKMATGRSSMGAASIRGVAGATLALVACIAMSPVSAQVQAAPKATLADYQRAALFQNAHTLVSRMNLVPNWIDRSDQFWYVDESGQGDDKIKTFVRVDPARNQQKPAFDHVKIAKGLSTASGKEYKASALPFGWFAYADGGNAIRLRVDEADWHCDLKAYVCKADVTAASARDGEVLSPDGRWAVSVLDYNLQVRDTTNGQMRALTHDGKPEHVYGVSAKVNPVTSMLTSSSSWPVPRVWFSPDSRYILVYRADLRRVRELSVIQTKQGAGPVTHTYRYPIAGDPEVPQVEVFVSELGTGALRKVDVPMFGLVAEYGMVACWSEEITRACFTEDSRGYKSMKLHVVDVATGHAHVSATEHSETQVNRGSQARLLGNDLVWSSERDGWNHLYRIDAGSGKTQQQLTRGEWAVRDIVHVDTKSKKIYFTAGGRESGQDPYYRHLYRIGLDGSQLEHLTPESADHTIAFSPAGNYFIDTYSRLDQAPVSVLRRANGQVVRELQRADISRLQAAGWKPGLPFTVKAHDGRTDLHGAMFLPSNFDPSRRYPVLDAIYPGPQMIRTPKSFDVSGFGGFRDEIALAELGFIVVTIDGLGTPLRSKAFRDASYRNMGAAGGLEDHIAGLRQLAQSHPYLDLERVGIYGHSGGGYASARALLKFPEFYKVAVSSAGNHDQRSYAAEWGERYHAWPMDPDVYASQANPPLAGNLRGKLLLVHGDMDDNVHHTQTMQLVDALVEANKNFDLLILPNRDHMLANVALGKNVIRSTDPYFLRRRWDYFVEHLQGGTPQEEFSIEAKGQ